MRVLRTRVGGHSICMSDADRREFEAVVRRAEAQGQDPPVRTRRRVLAIVAGAVIGYAIGGGFVLLVDRVRYSGSASDIVVWLLGLPILLAIGGAVIGSLLAAWPAVEDVDAPLRMRRFARQRRAATSEQGQQPGSPVPPRYVETSTTSQSTAGERSPR
jgi:hypothetical protein